ncbi:glycosyltransferase family 4 protein [Candidatus Daviesbacteria bacterium]|nr:glycosyltransferase family 4 protein [Candidatus Daviesbacteria bacterium]
MKIAIYSPYLDTFGGGEKYMMSIGEILSQNNFEVDILLDKNLENKDCKYLKNELSKRFNLNLERVSFIRAPIGEGSNFFSRFFFLKKYTVFFYLSDGSIFYPTARKNILHIQSPIIGQPAKSLWGKIKLKGWNLIIYNSQFTQKYSQNNWPLTSQVIYPPVDTEKIKLLGKKNYILSVGRFFGYLKDKKHAIMIKAFKDLYKGKKVDGWSLYLVGVASKGDEPYLMQLRNLSKGFPINFYPNLAYNALMTLYGQSSIYWHAAGFGEEDPTKMEHFGISTVEAMAAGSVPVVVNGGGQTEIVEDGKSGFLWNSLKDLQRFTTSLIKDQNLRSKLSQNAVLASHKFSKKRFEKEILKVVDYL